MIRDYRNRKLKGLITLTLENATVYANVRQFDPDDGSELPPWKIDLILPQLQAKRDDLQAQLDEIDEILKDMAKAKVS